MADIASLTMNSPENRYQGALPKVGIRPVIDGRRRGVRESLEAPTMALAKAAARLITENLKHPNGMPIECVIADGCIGGVAEAPTMALAKAAARLITENLRHPNGMPIECVIADSCIGGVAEAAACQDKFSREQVQVTLTVTPCWCYGSETMDMDPRTIKAVWGFNGTDRPGAVYLAAVLAGHSQKGLPAFGIYGRDVQDFANIEEVPEDVREKLLRFVRAALAAAWMRGKSYLAIGSVSMGIAGSIVNADFFQEYLGMRNEYVDMSELVRRFDEKIYSEAEFRRAMDWVTANCKNHEGPDNNPPAEQHGRRRKDEVWKTCVKMAMIVRDLMVGNTALRRKGLAEEALGHNALAAGFQGQRHWNDHFPNGDFLEAVLNSSYDWNGIRSPYIVATENDSLNGVSMLFGHLLTGAAQIFSDVRTYWSPAAIERVTGWKPEGAAAGGLIHLINSGSASLDGTGKQRKDGKPAMKPFWEISPEEAGACLDAVQWRYASLGYFRGGGYSSDFLTEGGMPVTMCRLNLVKGLGPVLQLAEGWTVDIPEHVHDKLDQRTDPTWPSTWFAPRLTGEGPFADVYSVMNNWGANHGAISYGHIGADLVSLAAILRIPVCMHNLGAERIFRPSYWNSFGMDKEGADYRACAALGPLYR